MKTAIIGCGAMGTVIGAFMTKNGLHVDMFDSYEAHVEKMKEEGVKIIGTENFNVNVNAKKISEIIDDYDVIILLTKQLANKSILPVIKSHLVDDGIVVVLQNGVPEPYVASYVGEGRTIGGTILWGATFIGPGKSEVTQDLSRNDHLFEIGQMNGEVGESVQKAKKVLEYMGPTKITTKLMDSRWGKLINNACMSGMSAACGCTFGEVLDNPKARACLSYIGREVKLCCEAEGFTLPILLHDQSPDTLGLETEEIYKKNQEMFLDMYSDMRTAKASMLQDLEKGRKSEVTMINGYVVQIGEKHGIKTPFNKKVVDIVHGIEDGRLQLDKNNISLFEDSMFEYKF